MIKSGISIYDGTNWIYAIPKVYDGSSWVTAAAYVYDNSSWNLIGGAGTNMIEYTDSSGKNIIDANSNNYLVKQT